MILFVWKIEIELNLKKNTKYWFLSNKSHDSWNNFTYYSMQKHLLELNNIKNLDKDNKKY